MTLWLALLFLSLGSFGPCLAQSDLSGKNILIVHAAEANAPIFGRTDRGLSDTLRAGKISVLNQYFESLDLRRNPGTGYRKLLVEQMREKYEHRRIDLIVAMFPEALDFVLNDCRDVLPNAPILALYLPQGIELPKTESRIIGHFPSLDIMGTLEIALRLVPEAKRVYVVSGVHDVDKRAEEQAKQISSKWKDQLEFVYVSHLPYGEMLQTLSGVPSGSVILLLSYSQAAGEQYKITPEVAEQLKHVVRVPIFGVLDVALGHGIVGGSLISFELIGKKTGQLALDILAGANAPGNIPDFLDVPPVPMFDWRELKRWNMDEDALPKGSIVVNREFTSWDYRYYILGFLAFCVLEAILIVILLAQRRRRNEAETALRESEERLDLATASAEAGIWSMNLDKGSVWVTDKLRELFRFALDEELTYERFLEVIHSEDRAHVIASVRRSLEKREPLVVEYRIVHPDGAIRWIASRGSPYPGSSDRPERLLGVSNDVTQRKLTELQLRESQTLLSALVDSTSDMIWSVDAERFGLLTFNRGLSEYFLKQRGIQIRVGMRPEDLFPAGEYVQTWRTFYRKALGDGLYATECRVYAGTRTLLLNLNRLERDGVVFGVAVFGKDITDRLRAEEEVRTSESKYRNLYDSMMDGYVLVGIDGRILQYNETYRGMTGYSQSELQGLTYRDITPVKWHKAEKEILEQEVLLRGYSDVYEKEYRRKDGTVFPIELRTFLLRNELGSNIGMWAIVRDISGRRQIESEARKLREDLAHVTRVSTMGELTSSLAHEINQPLAAILSNAQAAQRFLAQENPDLKEIDEILGDIIRDDNRAAEVIRKIRALLKKEETRFEELSLNEVVEEILNVIRNDTALAALAIEKAFDPSLPAVWGDRIQLQQVILNLVINAAEAMKHGSLDRRLLTVRTSKKDERFAEVSVVDTGPGIEGRAAERLFEPFYTTKSGGMGMGLAISRHIVASHKGEIRAVNNPDAGTTVSFTVPFDGRGKP